MTVIFILSPFTVENATLIVPLSHKLGHNYLSKYDPPVSNSFDNELPEPLPEPLIQTPARASGVARASGRRASGRRAAC